MLLQKKIFFLESLFIYLNTFLIGTLFQLDFGHFWGHCLEGFGEPPPGIIDFMDFMLLWDLSQFSSNNPILPDILGPNIPYVSLV